MKIQLMKANEVKLKKQMLKFRKFYFVSPQVQFKNGRERDKTRPYSNH